MAELRKTEAADPFQKSGGLKGLRALASPAEAAALFAGWQETMIWSCLQGVMGSIYTDCGETGAGERGRRERGCREQDFQKAEPCPDIETPLRTASPLRAAAVLGDFCFLAGAADCGFAAACRNLFADYAIFVPGDKDWENAIEEAFGSRAKKIIRYATEKTADGFDRAYLQELARQVPAGFQLCRIDEELFAKCLQQVWCRDLVSQYDDYSTYEKLGQGVVLVEACSGEVVSGASAYTAYEGGIEIEADTKEGFRRQGMAGICCAQLILNCLKRGIYPSWDAHTKASLALAEKLGYRPAGSYTAYEIFAVD